MPNVIADDTKLAFLRWLVAEDEARQNNYRQYREYYDGVHDTQLTERQRQYLELRVDQEFNDNYCQIPVDALSERLTITGVQAGEIQSPILWSWLKNSNIDGLQGIVHTCAIRDGDSYLLTEWDNEKKMPTFTYEMACCDGDGVKVHYSTERRTESDFASKRWRVTQGAGAGHVRRLNLYYPDRVEKYISDQGASEGEWQQYAEGGEPWPLPWTSPKTGDPLGVPAIHYKNNETGYPYGTSELANIIPLQNALNKSIIDLLAAADTTAFRTFWMLGDNPTGVRVSPGSWIYSVRAPSGPEGVAVGYFPGEDLTPLISLKDSAAMEIARVSRTPLSMFQISGHIAAEGTMKQQEAPLVSKARKRQIYFGNAWESALIVARRLWNAYGPGPELDETQSIEMLWANPETRNVKEDLEIATMKRGLGVSLPRIWGELGYDAEAIEEFKTERDADALRERNLGEQMLRAFDAGDAMPGGRATV